MAKATNPAIFTHFMVLSVAASAGVVSAVGDTVVVPSPLGESPIGGDVFSV